MSKRQGTDALLSIGESTVRGANAEVLCVLQRSSSWKTRIKQHEWTTIAEALDNRTPPDERAKHAESVLERIHQADPIARWLPRPRNLSYYEFHQDFYPAYRDHTIHTLQTFLLGAYLWETCPPLRTPLGRSLSARTASQSEDIFQSWWTIASLWHDAGYPFETQHFITSQETRTRILQTLSDDINADQFRLPISAALSRNIPPKLLADFHRAGRYTPLVFPEHILGTSATATLDPMWERLGFSPHGESPSASIDRLTTQRPLGRSPYHDHGLYGAALLLLAAKYSTDYLDELSRAFTDPRFPHFRRDHAGATLRIEEDYLALLEHGQSVISMAAEAVAYHNVDFRAFAFDSDAARPIASLDLEPHIVFLALADTLQDWDRHHFRPDAKYRPSVRSDQVVLQGTPTGIFARSSRKQSLRLEILALFKGWVDGIDALIFDGGSYSFPADLQCSAGAYSVHEAEAHQVRFEIVESRLRNAVSRARDIFRLGAADAYLEAVAILDPEQRRVAELRERVLATDRKRVDDMVRSSGLPQIERTAANDVQEGTTLPVGRVVRKIGGGGFGDVWLVEPTRPGPQLAVKVFHAMDLSDGAKRALFERGFRAMEFLRYEPNVVRVHDLLHLPFGISMEYIQGPNLEEAIHTIKDSSERVSVLYDIAKTLASAHHKGIIHRDVKPGNVLLKEGSQAMLTDFDLAYVSGKTTRTSAMFASQQYGAPEQFNPRLVKWSRQPCVDVYGFGALTYFTLTMQSPPLSGLFGAEQWAVLRRDLDNQVSVKTASALLELVQNATMSDPDRRLEALGGDGQEVMERIVSILEECVRDTKWSAEASIPWDQWLREVVFSVTGDSLSAQPFLSRSGGTEWSIKVSAGNLIAQCRLIREPRFEGVNYEGFTRASSRQVDKICRSFSVAQSNRRATRRGELRGAGSQLTIDIQGISPSRASAFRAAELLGAISRSIE